MQPFYILNLQSIFTLIAFSLIAKWYINPRLSKTSVEDALLPLVWVHVFRYAPLTLLVPGQVSPDIPIDVAMTIAYGDLISAIAALITVLFLKQRLPGALIVAWAFNILGVADIVIATAAAINAKLYQYALGFNWYIVNFYVPIGIVTHAMMIYKLVYAKK